MFHTFTALGRASERPGWEEVLRFGDLCYLKREDELVRLDAAPLFKTRMG
jgi:hypothetical protein